MTKIISELQFIYFSMPFLPQLHNSPHSSGPSTPPNLSTFRLVSESKMLDPSEMSLQSDSHVIPMLLLQEMGFSSCFHYH